MRRLLLLTFGLLATPAIVAAQVEIGFDAGLSIESIDDVTDNVTAISVPAPGMRVGFAAGEMIVVETRLGLDYFSFGDASGNSINILPGVNVLLGEQFYVRGEVGLSRDSFDDGAGSESETQYVFGGAAGLRKALGDGVLFRAEVGVDRWMENTDDFLPASWEFRLGAGVSAVIN